jgi:hypothetical protein
MMYAVKKIPAELRRGAVLGIIGSLLAIAVMYSRNENAPTEVASHSSKQAFQQPKDRPQAEGWFTPTPRAPEISDKGPKIADALPLPRARPVTPGFYYEMVREQGDGEGNYVLVERQCIPGVDMPKPCYTPERGRQKFPLRHE